jgi:hypothetical protein
MPPGDGLPYCGVYTSLTHSFSTDQIVSHGVLLAFCNDARVASAAKTGFDRLLSSEMPPILINRPCFAPETAYDRHPRCDGLRLPSLDIQAAGQDAASKERLRLPA